MRPIPPRTYQEIIASLEQERDALRERVAEAENRQGLAELERDALSALVKVLTE